MASPIHGATLPESADQEQRPVTHSYPTALAKDVDPDGVFERAYAEVAGTIVVDEPVRGASL